MVLFLHNKNVMCWQDHNCFLSIHAQVTTVFLYRWDLTMYITHNDSVSVCKRYLHTPYNQQDVASSQENGHHRECTPLLEEMLPVMSPFSICSKTSRNMTYCLSAATNRLLGNSSGLIIDYQKIQPSEDVHNFMTHT